MDQSRLNFIDDELNEWGELVNQELRKALTRMGIGVTDELYQSIAYQVMQAAAGHDGKYNLSFHEYGRFRDMGTGKGGRGAFKETTSGNRKKWVGRKPKKFYSRTVYGMLNRLIESLLYGYQTASADGIKTALL